MLAADSQQQTFQNQLDSDNDTNARCMSRLTDLCRYVDQCKLSRVIQNERHNGMIFLYTATSNIENIIIIVIVIITIMYIDVVQLNINFF